VSVITSPIKNAVKREVRDFMKDAATETASKALRSKAQQYAKQTAFDLGAAVVRSSTSVGPWSDEGSRSFEPYSVMMDNSLRAAEEPSSKVTARDINADIDHVPNYRSGLPRARSF
jgi:hypothetical protein